MSNEGNEIQAQIKEFLTEFPDMKANGISVSDIKYDGWPVWWFFRWRFIADRLISPLPSHSRVTRSILNNQKPSFKQKFKNKITVFTLRKFLEYNENIKIFASKFSKRKYIPKKKNKRIMFMAHTNGIIHDTDYGFTVDRIGTVVNEVRKDPELEDYISVIDPLSHTSWLKLLKHENLVYSYVDKEIKEKSRKEASLLHKKWKKISNQLKPDPILEHFRPALEVFFSREVIYIIILYYETYKKVIKQEQIDLICFYAGSDVLSKCAIAASHKYGIKSLHISHGLGVHPRNPEQFDSAYYAVVGPKYSEMLIRMGIDSENIFIIGPVFMDEITSYIQEEYPDNKTKKILLATTPWLRDNVGDRETYVNYISRFLREMNILDNVKIILKLHPREKTADLYRSIINSQGYENVKIVGSQGRDQLKSRLYNLINESDIVMSFGSTVSVEAMIIGRPSFVIELMSGVGGDDPILTDRKRVLHTGPKEDLSKIIGKILSNPEMQKEIINNQNDIVHEYLYQVDGKAGERVLNIMKQLVGG